MASRVVSVLILLASTALATAENITVDVDTAYVIEPDSPLYLPCNLDVPFEEVIWYKGDALYTFSNAIRFENNTLEIRQPRIEDAGVYRCVVNGNPTKNRTFVVKSHPNIGKLPKTVNLVEGDPLTLPCKAEGFPLPNITWYKDGKLLKQLNVSKSGHVQITSDNGHSEDTLRIKELNMEDIGEYMCEATNEISVVNVTVMVGVKDKLAALWPFLGIVAEVTILCTLIFFYERHRAKKNFEENENEQSPESKPMTEQKEGEVRQRTTSK